MTVIFDCDGVIVDDRKTYYPAIYKTVNHFLKKLKIETYKKEEIIDFKFKNGINNDWDLVCFGILKKMGKWKRNMKIKEALEILKNYGITYEDVVKKFDEIYFKIKDREKLFLDSSFFEKLKKKKIKLGIVTGRIKKDLFGTLKKFNLKKYFSFIYTEDDIPDVEFRKPSPFLLDKAIRENCRNDKTTIFVGDSIADKKMVEFSKYKERIKFISVDFSKRKIFKDSIKTKNELLKEILKYENPTF